ncbi:GroES-like protein, partial [Tothia fuscella]
MRTFTIFKGSKSGDIVKSQTTLQDLMGDQLYIRITASGLCGTDLHYTHSDSCLGHEGCGIVEAVGPSAKRFNIGDRVGFGYLRESCGYCQQCLSGNEIFCANRDTYENPSNVGSMASHTVWRESYVFAIPAAMADEDAAPLMCGGATVFNVLRLYDVKPTERVGIIGVGGLGHLAIQFAAKMGCDVTVFSGSDSKKEEVLGFGAKHFVATKGVKGLDLQGRQLDRLLVTTSAQPDWDLYIPAMAPMGTIFLLSVSTDKLVMPYTPLLLQGLRIQGSLVASRHTLTEMLEFAALHSIKPTLMKFPLTVEGIAEGVKTLEGGSMRYRGVLIP